MHCASLGEYEQGRPVLEKLRSVYPHHVYIISFFSPSGYEIVSNKEKDAYVFYLPMGSREQAEGFVNWLSPDLILWIKYDYWYHYLAAIKKRNIPCLLISAVFRKEQVFFKWYGNLHRKMLSFFKQLFVQNNESKQLLKTIGVENCTVSGDTRFDRVVEIASNSMNISYIEKSIVGKKCIVAGSTWKHDEEMLRQLWDKMKKENLKLIIAPHEIHAAHLKDLQEIFPEAVFYAGRDEGDPAADIIIINTVGMLSSLYKYADICYVGGGFTKDGVHNVLEAAVYGKPVMFGPNYQKYKEAIDLIESGGGDSLVDSNELYKKVSVLFSDKEKYLKQSKASADFVRKNTGATEKILSFIQQHHLR